VKTGDCQIIDIPFTIFKGVFEKEGDLISKENSLWRTPTTGSQAVTTLSVYMVASESSPTNPHRVALES
jgi:hypothetical protein